MISSRVPSSSGPSSENKPGSGGDWRYSIFPLLVTAMVVSTSTTSRGQYSAKSMMDSISSTGSRFCQSVALTSRTLAGSGIKVLSDMLFSLLVPPLMFGRPNRRNARRIKSMGELKVDDVVGGMSKSSCGW